MYLELDGQGPRYGQLVRALKEAVLSGRLAAGERLPATRAFAAELGVSRNTVLVAYEQLVAEGFATGRVGAGTYVASIATMAQPQRPNRTVSAQSRYAERSRGIPRANLTHTHRNLRYNLQYGAPNLNPQIAAAWRRAMHGATSEAFMDYPGPRGNRLLRQSISRYLAVRRGVRSQPEDVLIVSGAQQAFALASRVLLDEDDTVVLEEPTYFGLWQMLKAHGARLLSIPVDSDGLRCQDLPGSGAKLVCVTPSHQFPSGAVMSLSRRLELLGYAADHDAWIIEDDYDGEFRYDAKPLAALQSLDDADRVIYVGTFSKMLFPALRLGYMVLPRALREDFVAAKWFADLGCPTVEQAALANFMESPGFDTHLRSANRTLKARREALMAGLRRYAGERVEVVDSPAGMHAVVWLQDYNDEDCDGLIEMARRRGLGLYPIKPHYLGKPPRPGLLLGYAGLPAKEITRAMRLFGECLDSVSSPPG